jgi:glutathionylspermidine synthase
LSSVNFLSGERITRESPALIVRVGGGSVQWDQPMVYQQYAEMESVEVETLKGMFRGKRLWGSFLVGGKASAILARIDRHITGNNAYFLPMGLK